VGSIFRVFVDDFYVASYKNAIPGIVLGSDPINAKAFEIAMLLQRGYCDKFPEICLIVS